MQLEETASSKDVPPLSARGVFELTEFVAQNNMRPVGENTVCCGFLVSACPVCNRKKSLVC
jgi:hypothetical protein